MSQNAPNAMGFHKVSSGLKGLSNLGRPTVYYGLESHPTAKYGSDTTSSAPV